MIKVSVSENSVCFVDDNGAEIEVIWIEARPLSVPIRFVPQESHSQAGSTNFCEETYLTSTLGEGLGSFFFHKVCIFY